MPNTHTRLMPYTPCYLPELDASVHTYTASTSLCTVSLLSHAPLRSAAFDGIDGLCSWHQWLPPRTRFIC